MVTILYATLVGSNDGDTLGYRQKYGPGDTVTEYVSIYGMGGDDHIRIGKYEPPLFIDAGDGDDEIVGNINGGLPIVTVFGGKGDDVISYFGYSGNLGWKLDGGEGNDELVSGRDYDGRYITNFETLTIVRSLFVEKGQLTGFDWVNIGSETIKFRQHGDLSDVHFSRGEGTIHIDGSHDTDNFDLSGETRNFTINGNAGADIIVAGTGKLYAMGGGGGDSIKGGAGDDLLAVGRQSGVDTMALETVLGMGGKDRIWFEGARGVYDGGKGYDTLAVVGNGKDFDTSKSTFVGFESLYLSSHSTFLTTAAFVAGLHTLEGDGKLGFTSATVLSHLPEYTGRYLTLNGSDEKDSFALTGASASIIFDGRGGDDTFRAGLKSVDLSGGDDDDRLFGSSDRDTISGDAGGDHLYGGDGRDSIAGGDGNDALFGGSGNDRLDGGNGHDSVQGGDCNDELKMRNLTSADSLLLNGGAGDDRFVYGSYYILGNKRFWIMEEAAKLDIVGGEGHDTLVLSGDLSRVSARGVETFTFVDEIWARPDFIESFERIRVKIDPSKIEAFIHLTTSGRLDWSGPGINAILDAADGKDVFDFSQSGKLLRDVYLNGGNDVLRIGKGGTGAAVVGGGDGNDTVYGSVGKDVFYGGAGKDTFVAGGGNDEFRDFISSGNDADVIDLSNVSSIKSYQDLMDHHLKQYPSETYIDMGHQGRLYLEGSEFSFHFTAANFLF